MPKKVAKLPKSIVITLTWWGKFRFMFQFLSFYISVVSLSMVAITAYNTTLRDWAMIYFGIDLTLWLFIASMFGIMLLGMAIEKVATVPYLIGQGNREAYKHDNPMRADLESIKKEQTEAKKREDERDQKISEQSLKLEEILRLLKKEQD